MNLNEYYQTESIYIGMIKDAFKDVIKSVTIKSDRFDFEPEITAKMLKKKIRLKEVPITYSGRGHNEGKKIGWKDGVHAILALIKFRFID